MTASVCVSCLVDDGLSKHICIALILLMDLVSLALSLSLLFLLLESVLLLSLCGLLLQ